MGCQRQTQVLDSHDRVRADALGAEQYDLRPPNAFLRRVAVLDQSAEPIVRFSSEKQNELDLARFLEPSSSWEMQFTGRDGRPPEPRTSGGRPTSIVSLGRWPRPLSLKLN